MAPHTPPLASPSSQRLDGSRTQVMRADGRVVNVVQPRGQLFVCATGCCCGRTDDGFPSVPTQLLGPCALANVVLLLFDGQARRLHSINSEPLVRALYDHVGAMVDADRCLPFSPALAPYEFRGLAWPPP